MLSVGSNIASRTDKLQKVKVEYLYNSLRNPKPAIETRIRQLRAVRELDINAYKNLKRQLPYIVCAAFNPPFRNTDNFAYTEYFIIDIDHISEKGLDMVSLRERLSKDERVLMMFTSPGEDGLKLLLRLSERCYDSGLYSLFYKAFIKEFSNFYSLEQVVDSKTSDVTRACFISTDHDAYFNPDAQGVAIKDYVDTSDVTAVFDLKNELDKVAAENDRAVKAEDPPKPKDPDDDVLAKIKAQLKDKREKRVKEEVPVYVPEQLDALMEGLREYITAHGVTISEVRNIQYAKKVRLQLGQRKAEINIFYGKHGFKVVQSPKSGTSAELNAVCAELVDNYITENFV